MAKVALFLLVALCAACAAAGPKDNLKSLLSKVKRTNYNSMVADNAAKMTKCEADAAKGKSTDTTTVLETCYTTGWMRRRQGARAALSAVGDCVLSGSPTKQTIEAAIALVTCTSNAYKR